MGNYKDIEIDFIKRTLNLLAQYEGAVHKYKFEEQYNYTLLINCLLGLVVLPKEKSLSYLPSSKLDEKARKEMGLTHTKINTDYTDLKSLIIAMRHAISHFNIEIKSMDNLFHIDQIIFKNDSEGKLIEIVSFRANELLPFIRYYSTWLLSNIKKH